MKNKVKTYILMLSKVFPVGHPRAGQPTDFKTKKAEGVKKHTIRGNVELWEHRAEEINAGRAVLSVRQWSGKPYEPGSHQIEIARHTSLHTQRISIPYEWHPALQVFLPASQVTILTKEKEAKVVKTAYVAANDGLSIIDFRHWFASRKKQVPFNRQGIILHFTESVY